MRRIRILIRQDPKRLAAFGDHPLSDLPDPLPNIVGRHDAELAVGQLLYKHGGAGRVTSTLELTRDRNDVAVTHAPDFDDLHIPSIYADIRVQVWIMRPVSCAACDGPTDVRRLAAGIPAPVRGELAVIPGAHVDASDDDEPGNRRVP